MNGDFQNLPHLLAVEELHLQVPDSTEVPVALNSPIALPQSPVQVLLMHPVAVLLVLLVGHCLVVLEEDVLQVVV